MLTTDRDTDRLLEVEARALHSHDRLESALLKLSSAPTDEQLALRLARRWAKACDASHAWAEYALGYRLRDPSFGFRYFAETCRNLYIELVEIRAQVLAQLVDVPGIAEVIGVSPTFLSALQQVVLEGAPDLWPQLEATARASGLPIRVGGPPAAVAHPSATVHRIHFDVLDGHTFEKLVFAYLIRSKRMPDADWAGEVGGDEGRDVVGTIGGQPALVQCANRVKLTFAKLRDDLDAAIARDGVPHTYMIVAGQAIGPKVRRRIEDYSRTRGVSECVTWSGQTFEERVREDAESLLLRFVMGVPFPDAVAELRAAASR